MWTRSGDGDTAPFQHDPPVPALTIERAEWSQDLEPGIPYASSLGTHCGIDQLGEFNGHIWQLAGPLADSGGGYGVIYGVIVLSESDEEPAIELTEGGNFVGRYVPQPLTELRLCS